MVVQYKNTTSYPQRTYDPPVQILTNTTTNKTLYLLNTVDGIYVTFQIVNVAQQPLSGVAVNATRVIGSEDVVIGDGTTDASGTVTFWMNPDFLHTLAFFKTGYPLAITSLTPTQSSYTISLGGGTTSTEINYYKGMVIGISPTKDFLTNNTLYNFSLSINSTYWALDNFGYTIYFGDGSTADTQSSISSAGGILNSLNINASSDSMYMRYYFTINGTIIYSESARTWGIDTITGTEFSIYHFFTDLDLYLTAGMFGADSFFRILLSFIILVMVCGGVSYNYGLRSEAAILTIMWGVVLFLDVGVGLLPGLQIGDRTPIAHFYSYIITVILIGILIKESQQ